MSTTNSNFAKLSASISGAATPLVLALAPNAAASLVNSSGAQVLDKYSVDLSSAGHAKNGAFYLSLIASTPITVDLTAISSAASASAGDTTFANANELIFWNTGAQDVIVSPGASNGFSGPLGGSAPTFTVPAGARLRWQSPAGWPISGTVKTLKFDPGASPATIGCSVGGS